MLKHSVTVAQVEKSHKIAKLITFPNIIQHMLLVILNQVLL